MISKERRKENNHKYIKDHPEKIRELKKNWRKNNPDKVREQAKRYRKRHLSEIKARAKKYYDTHLNVEREKAVLQFRNLFNEVLEHYGNKCFVCGSYERPHIDHIGGFDGNGEYRTGKILWAWLRRNNYPPGFRILCQKCNTVDGFLRNHPALNVNGIDGLIQLKKEAGQCHFGQE